ncbi:MAG TPA: hypothetical protein VFG73_00420 [Rhodanobacteraceae bacterium]|nr:hypothetical protein [Rhodanobacteraceae bacterium]
MESYLWVRALHIVVAALWVGGTTFLGLFVAPVLRGTGRSGDEVMQGLHRRSVGPFFAVAGLLTVLSGLWLYWHFTGFRHAAMLSGPGLAFGIGGLLGILAAVVGGAIVGRSVEQVVALDGTMAAMPEGHERQAQAMERLALERRVARASAIDIVLLLAALVLMSIGHAL